MSNVVEQVEPKLAAMMARVLHGIAAQCRIRDVFGAGYAAQEWRGEMQTLQKPGLADAFGDIAQYIQTQRPDLARREALTQVVVMRRQARGQRWRPECGPGV